MEQADETWSGPIKTTNIMKIKENYLNNLNFMMKITKPSGCD